MGIFRWLFGGKDMAYSWDEVRNGVVETIKDGKNKFDLKEDSYFVFTELYHNSSGAILEFNCMLQALEQKQTPVTFHSKVFEERKEKRDKKKPLSASDVAKAAPAPPPAPVVPKKTKEELEIEELQKRLEELNKKKGE